MLTIELNDLLADGFALEMLGFDPKELSALLEPEVIEGLTDEDAVPDVPDEPTTKLGNIYQLGKHRLMCGDCKDYGSIEELLNGKQINIAITSPPYASQRTYDESSGFKPIGVDDFVEWYADVASNIMANLADDGSYFCNIKPNAQGLKRELYVFDLVLAHVREWGWNFADEFCWERTGIPQQVARRFKNQFEPIYHFTKGEWKFRPDEVKHKAKSVPKAKALSINRRSIICQISEFAHHGPMILNDFRYLCWCQLFMPAANFTFPEEMSHPFCFFSKAICPFLFLK
jgi:DNA modification methylase